MSKARLAIAAVIAGGRGQGGVARIYGVSRSWVSRLAARYRAGGEAAFGPRSRRPKASPRALPDATVALIIALRKELAGQGLDAGPDTICRHLEHHHRIGVSPATVSRCLARAGLVNPEPRNRPKPSYLRFEAELPNQCRQPDFTHYPLAGGTGTGILSWLDDHSRYALPVTARNRVTGPIVLAAFCTAAAGHGVPASTLTGNGMVFTTRLSGGKGGRNSFEHELRRPGITQDNGKPDHPQTQGKAERFQQTLKNWLAAQDPQPATLARLQALLAVFAGISNHQRPRRSLPRQATPAAACQARPKATPGNRASDTRHRVRTGRLDANGSATLRHGGKPCHTGTGRTQARTHVLPLVQDLHIRVINAATGELPRELTPDPNKNYQPTGRPPGPPPGTPRPPRKPKNPEP